MLSIETGSDLAHPREQKQNAGNSTMNRNITFSAVGRGTMSKFGNKDKYFRLQPYQDPQVLNSFQKWTKPECTDLMGLVQGLTLLMDKVEMSATDPKTGMLDCIAAASDVSYKIFENDVCELQCVSVETVEENCRLALWINIYNMMIKHAIVKMGILTTSHQRRSFKRRVSYNIGGHILSLDQIKHGIIRANSRAPHQLRALFSGNDKGLHLAMKEKDPRVHFAITRVASRFSPVKVFTNRVTEELDAVAQAFCQDEDNVSIDMYKWELQLNMIFHQYQSDFASAKAKLPAAVAQYLEGTKKETLDYMINSGKKVEVRFMPRDRSGDPKSSRQFTTSIPKNNVSPTAFFSPSCHSANAVHV